MALAEGLQVGRAGVTFRIFQKSSANDKWLQCVGCLQQTARVLYMVRLFHLHDGPRVLAPFTDGETEATRLARGRARAGACACTTLSVLLLFMTPFLSF